MQTPTVLLVGPQAEALASRLEASGYRTVLESAAAELAAAELAAPRVAVVSAGSAAAIPALRDRLGQAAILLDLGHDSVEARSDCLIRGADDFWLSAQGPSDLLMRLRLHLGLQRGTRQSEPHQQVADLTINLTLRQVRRGGRTIALTAREYQLLLFLVERSGQVLSRESILAGIWNDQQAATSNVIEVYVRYLRQKLEAGGERRLIHTVRGQGYCLATRPPSSRD